MRLPSGITCMGFKKLLTLFISAILFLFSSAQAQEKAPAGMILIPEGYFQMGTFSGNNDEKPMHFVYTSSFYIDKYEVSNKDYQLFMEATGHPEPIFWDDPRFNDPEQPVVGVSWHDAMSYSKWKGRRLPTEAEWEKSARGNDGRLWPWGGKFDKGFFFFFVNIFGKNDNYSHTAPVNYYHSGVSPFGLYNVAGNVWEWCLDWYDKNYYKSSPEINPEGPRGPLKMKVLRGGSWVNSIEGVKVVKRAHNYPNIKNEIYGFRTVLPVH
tara:strand:- start:4591 stop:5391 length:801 start_codon:yes stop_codon:yes gene_type:complete